MYEFICSKRKNYYITKNLPFTALPWDLTHFKYWAGTLGFPTESGKNWDWLISFITTPCEQTKVHAHFLEELDVLLTRLAINLHPSMLLGDLSILQSDSLASIPKKGFHQNNTLSKNIQFFGWGGFQKEKKKYAP